MSNYINLPVESGGGVSSVNTITGALILAAGSGVTLTPSGNTITIASSSGGSPGGSNGDIQYNNSGAFGGSAATIDSAGNITANTLIVPSISNGSSSSNNLLLQGNTSVGSPIGLTITTQNLEMNIAPTAFTLASVMYLLANAGSVASPGTTPNLGGRIGIESYGDQSAITGSSINGRGIPGISIQMGRGTQASPAFLNNNDQEGSFDIHVWNGTNVTAGHAGYRFLADENHSSSNLGDRFSLFLTARTTATKVEVIRTSTSNSTNGNLVPFNTLFIGSGNSLVTNSDNTGSIGSPDSGTTLQRWANIFAGTLIQSPIFQTTTANHASSGIVRLASADMISWRNQGNLGNVYLTGGPLSGTDNDLVFSTDAAIGNIVNSVGGFVSAGNILFSTDAAFDIGSATTASNPNNIYVDLSIQIGAPFQVPSAPPFLGGLLVNSTNYNGITVNSNGTNATAINLNTTNAIRNFVPSGVFEIAAGEGIWGIFSNSGNMLEIETGATSPEGPGRHTFIQNGGAINFLTFDEGSGATIISNAAVTPSTVVPAGASLYIPSGNLSVASNVGIGTTANNNASAMLQGDSTSQGFLPPRMTSTQMQAIATPAIGLIVFATDIAPNGKLCVYTSGGALSGWETITSA